MSAIGTGMNPFSSRHIKRNTAFAALAVWLFALASGMANACLLGVPEFHDQSHSHIATADSESSHGPAALTVQGRAVEGDDEHPDVTKKSCLKVCDDGSKAPVKLQTGSDLADPGTAPLVAIAWNAATPFVSAPCRTNDMRPPIVGPSCRVRYSRLAL